TTLMSFLAAFHERISLPVSSSHRRIVPSLSPTATTLPLAQMASALTLSPNPSRLRTILPSVTSKHSTVPSAPPAKTVWLSGVKVTERIPENWSQERTSRPPAASHNFSVPPRSVAEINHLPSGEKARNATHPLWSARR